MKIVNIYPLKRLICSTKTKDNNHKHKKKVNQQNKTTENTNLYPILKKYNIYLTIEIYSHLIRKLTKALCVSPLSFAAEHA